MSNDEHGSEDTRPRFMLWVRDEPHENSLMQIYADSFEEAQQLVLDLFRLYDDGWGHSCMENVYGTWAYTYENKDCVPESVKRVEILEVTTAHALDVDALRAMRAAAEAERKEVTAASRLARDRETFEWLKNKYGW